MSNPFGMEFLDRENQMSEYDFVEWLQDLLMQATDIDEDVDDFVADDVRKMANKLDKVRNFDEAMMLGSDLERGLIFKFKTGEEFQLPIRRAR